MLRLTAIIAALGVLAFTPIIAQDKPEAAPEAPKEEVDIIRLPGGGEVKIIRKDGKVIIEKDGKPIDGEADKRIEDAKKRIEELRKIFDDDDMFKRLKEWDDDSEQPDVDEIFRKMQERMEEFRKRHEETFKKMRERMDEMRKQAEGEWEKSADDPDAEVIEKEYTSPDGSTRIKVKIVRKVSKSEAPAEPSKPAEPAQPEDSKAEPVKEEDF